MALMINALIIILIVLIAIVLAIIIKRKSMAIIGAALIAGGATGAPSLDGEYKGWLASREQEFIATEGLDTKHTYEMRAILERWHLSMHNKEVSQNATAKMKEEIIEKGIRPQSNADALVARIAAVNIDTIARDAKHLQLDADQLRNKLIIAGGTIKLAKMTENFQRARIDLLLKIARDAGAKDPQEAVAIAALRYAAMVPGGQQWSIPARVYEVLVRDFGATIEGFASPFNSQIIKFKDTHFCSLFPDTDAIFGSIGDFFSCDLSGKCAIINPPYVASLMEIVAKKCIETVEKATSPTRLFIVVPSWIDATFFTALNESKKLERCITHEKFATFFEDSITGAQIPASFKTTVFVLSSKAQAPTASQWAALDAAFKLDRAR